ncbi:hypothetical protein K469DRAFT_114231 [Zopfia rhizophila CBS 207.26]|uniref:AMP-activated protein kinase glycogen-binding domain-containing protein n=1 Tax=Zopfia rhizophila CBS 207.26 TaxID=1314779 RepID=A0A6A6E6A2_9PEZI|nr:hypothetical protein K469DRAFT_114231 [Zopfia rhizophila CBS 207.26]
MTRRAKIAFSQAGVKPPVYVVTSMSSPPWETLEMSVEEKRADTGDLIFSRQFESVPEGKYQYKIRIGEGHWVVDETKEAATDEVGNRNNVVHVESDVESASLSSSTDISTDTSTQVSSKEQRQDSLQLPPAVTISEHEIIPSPEAEKGVLSPSLSDAKGPGENNAQVSVQPSQSMNPSQPEIAQLTEVEMDTSPSVSDAKDSGQDDALPNQPPIVPIPYTVVEKVPDKAQPDYGDAESGCLTEDPSKRAADAEPDVERIVRAESPVQPKEQPKAQAVPTVIVEKTGNEPSHGDDFGEKATPAQKLAHEYRAADATPDEVVISPETKAVNLPIDEYGPKGEDFIEPEKPVDFLAGKVDSKEGDLVEPAEEPAIEPGTLGKQAAPLFKHESFDISGPENVASDAPPIMDTIEEESATSSAGQTSSQVEESEPSNFSEIHEEDEDDTTLSSGERSLGELDNTPLLSHETGSSRYGVEESDEQDANEEDSAVVEDDDEVENDTLESKQVPAFSHENFEDEREGSEVPLLPHERNSIAPSIDTGSEFSISESNVMEDGVPVFPHETATTSTIPGQARGSQFFVRRTSSGTLPNTLPVSDELDEDLHDPSLEKFPIGREAILERVATISSSIPEDETLDLPGQHQHHSPVISQACSSSSLAPSSPLNPVAEEEQSESDSHPDIPSPAVESAPTPLAREQSANAPSSTVTGDSNAAREDKPSETDSVQKDNGTKDDSKDWGELYDSIATPTTALNTLTPPLTPEKAEIAKRADSPPAPKPHQKHTRKPSTDSMPIIPEQPQKENWFSAFLRVVLGPIGRFITACFGGRKQASGAVLVVGVAVAVYYYLAVGMGK